MKKIQYYFLPVFIIMLVIMAACSGSPGSELVGTWVVEDVQTDVDTSQIKPEVLQRTVEMYRAVSFEFFEGDSMNLISDGNVHAGTWEFRPDEEALYMLMDGSRAPEPQKFADYKDGKLVNTNNTRLGIIVVTYIRQ